jgi:amino acid adenylation domain-containing protein
MHTYLLSHLLSKSAYMHSDRLAVIVQDETLSYQELETKSNQLAHALIRQGIKRGDRIGLLVRKSIVSLISIFGILKAGGTYVPIDPLAPSERITYIIKNCGIKILISGKELAAVDAPSTLVDLRCLILANSLPESWSSHSSAVEIVTLSEIFKGESDSEIHPVLSDCCPAYILYTSGSTGAPKGVAITHLNSLTFIKMAANVFNISPNDRLGNHSPLHFDLSVFDIFTAVKKGASVVLIPEYFSAFPARLADYIESSGVTVWNSVPSVLVLLSEKGAMERFSFKSLRLVLFAGEIFPPKYLRFLMNRIPHARFFNLYGQTEANSSTWYEIKEAPLNDTWKIPIGKPFPNFEVFALNENKELISKSGSQGELYIKGSTVALGYWNEADKSLKSFVQNPLHSFGRDIVYKTGDTVTLDSEGNFVFVGRKDHMIKSRGFRIELEEIELALYNYSGIHQAAVIPVPDVLFGNRLIAFVSPQQNKNLSARDILTHCAQLLPNYMIPEYIDIRDYLPAMPNGKINRTELKTQALTILNELD